MTQIQPDNPRLPAGSAPVACVDIGGTKVAVSIADENGLRGQMVEPTAKVGPNNALADQILRMIGESCAKASVAQGNVATVGVSSCGPFLMREGVAELATPNICGGLAGPARGLPNDWATA